MDVVKTSEGRGEKRTFGRDITNSILDPIQTKHVTKQAHVFKAVDNMAVEELPISEAFVKDPREYMQRAAGKCPPLGVSPAHIAHFSPRLLFSPHPLHLYIHTPQLPTTTLTTPTLLSRRH